ncbi:unannotated protein [freshwater metagenome]|uniref:Unannotated protein n=1 Tax=freshwater metagenome TaxID=449393 RepID=A0A6J6Q0H3_9ZZZZ|nr:hypothetical protein [Actinomycetota bacterium]MSV85521.1 hypothetical protein [Actinomycetota bacterium]MSY22422.1 hypothetical protein [Actinomycetota bacterium]
MSVDEVPIRKPFLANIRAPKFIVAFLCLAGGLFVASFAAFVPPLSAPLSPIVCPGGSLGVGADVAQMPDMGRVSWSQKTSCTQNGVTKEIPEGLMFVLLMLLWSVPFLIILMPLSVRSLRRYRAQLAASSSKDRMENP